MELESMDTGECAGCHPLHWMQQKFVMMRLQGVEPHFVNIPVVLFLSALLETCVFERSVRELLRRHSALRMRYRSIGRQSHCACVADSTECEMKVVDLSSRDLQEQYLEAQSTIDSFCCQRFELDQGARVRVVAISLAQDLHIILFVCDHSAVDGWSAALIQREFITLYTAYSKQTPSGLREIVTQFSDVARQRNEWLKGPEAYRRLLEWDVLVAGASRVFQLPTDRVTAVRLPYAQDRTSGSLSSCSMAILRKLGVEHRTTLPMVALAAYVALLMRWSARNDLFVRLTHHGRDDAGIRNVVGCLYREFFLRVRVTQNASFADLLPVVRDAYLRALPFAELPSHELRERLPGGDSNVHVPSYNYVHFNAGMSTPFPANPLSRNAWKIINESSLNGYLEPATGQALAVVFRQSADGLGWHIEYDPELFEDTTVEYLSLSLGQILEVASSRPGAPL